jgi:FtsH-binding integral membrane protein
MSTPQKSPAAQDHPGALNRPSTLVRRSREALSALAAQFLLGMGANLLGSPAENDGAARVVAGIVLGLHALVGIGILVVAVRVWLTARREGVAQQAALWAFVVVVLTFLAGVGTMLTGSDWLSFAMSVGFVAAAVLYVAVGARALVRRATVPAC